MKDEIPRKSKGELGMVSCRILSADPQRAITIALAIVGYLFPNFWPLNA